MLVKLAGCSGCLRRCCPLMGLICKVLTVLFKVGQRGIRSASQGQGCRGCFGAQLSGLACIRLMQGRRRRQQNTSAEYLTGVTLALRARKHTAQLGLCSVPKCLDGWPFKPTKPDLNSRVSLLGIAAPMSSSRSFGLSCARALRAQCANNVRTLRAVPSQSRVHLAFVVGEQGSGVTHLNCKPSFGGWSLDVSFRKVCPPG